MARLTGIPGLTSARHGENKSIAVLLFDNMSGEPGNAFFADEIQDDVITSLAKIGKLRVVSRTSSSSFRDPAKRDVREIKRQLGVDHILEGSVPHSRSRAGQCEPHQYR